MDSNEVKAQNAAERHQTALNALGIDASPEEPSNEEDIENKPNQSDEAPEDKPENKEDAPDDGEDPEDDGEDSEEEGKDDDAEDDEDQDPEGDDPAKKTVPLKRHLEAKKTIKALKKEIEDLKKPKTETTVEETDKGEELSQLTEAALKEITGEDTYEEKDIAFIKKLVSATLKAQQKLSKTELAALSPELKAKLKLLDDFEKSRKEESVKTEQKAIDDNEWNEVLPEIKKKYPNATPALLAEAKKKLLSIAHSEKGGKLIEVGGEKKIVSLPFDFLIARNQKLFDTLLNVKASGKTFESGKDLGEEELDIDFTSPDMSPAKLAEYHRRRAAEKARTNDGKIRFS